MVKNLPTIQDTWVRFLGWEELLEKQMAIHSSILARRIPWTEEPGRLYSPWGHRVGHDWMTTGNILQVLFHSWLGELRLFVGRQCQRTAGILRLVSPGLYTFPLCWFSAVSFCIINYSWEYKDFLNLGSVSSKSLKLRVVWWYPMQKTCYFSYQIIIPWS